MAGEAGRDIVCAAVSSAAYMAANTVTEVQKLPAEAIAEDAKLRLLLEPGQEEAAAPVLAGLRLHLKMLSQQYPKAIKVYDSEV